MKNIYFLFVMLSTFLGTMTVKAQHECVDLGLPSGTLWATCNVGANTPWEYGDYFAWGDTEPGKLDDNRWYGWYGYKYSNSNGTILQKYNTSSTFGRIDGLTKLLPEDDAATVHWGSEWQTPSKEQCEELINSNYTTVSYESDVDMSSGYRITSKINGNSIFLPKAHYYTGASWLVDDISDQDCCYWSRSLYKEVPMGSYYMHFHDIPEVQERARYKGYSVRPVQTLPPVYTEFVEATGTLTYYYDNKKSSRLGVTEVYDPVDHPDAVRFAGYNDKVLRAVIDPSMKKALLTSMAGMFFGGADLETYEKYSLKNMTTILGLENLNTSTVTDMCMMFYGCSHLTSLDLSSFNTVKVTDMSSMFELCQNLTTIFCDKDWSTSSVVKNSNFMFGGCTALVGGKGTIYDSNVKDKTYARPDGGTSKPGYFTKEEVYTEFDAATGTLTYYYDANRETRTGITELYTPKDHDAMRFKDYYKKVTKAVIDPSMKDAPLTSTYSMFFGGISQDPSGIYALENMTEIDGLENLSTSTVTDMQSMFSGCYALTQLDLSSFNTSAVTNMNGMFSMCQALTQLDLSSFNTSNVKDFNGMFMFCNKLKMIDVSSFDISKATKMDYMFSYCGELTTIYCDKDWSSTSASSEYMFSTSRKLMGGKGTAYRCEWGWRSKPCRRPDNPWPYG